MQGIRYVSPVKFERNDCSNLWTKMINLSKEREIVTTSYDLF